MRALSFVLASCLFLGCATTSRVRDVEQRLDVVEGFLGIQLKRYDDSTWGKKLGGPEASEAVASVGTWVPAQAEKMLLGAGLAGGGGLTYPGSLTLSSLSIPTSGNCLTFSGGKICGGASEMDLYGGSIAQVLITSGTTYLGNATSVRGQMYNDNGGAVFISDAQGLCNGDGTSTECDGDIQAGTASLINYAGTAGSGTGITTNNTGSIRTFVHKITVAETALTAAATTQDITIWTVPAKTRLNRIVVSDVTGFTGGGLTAMTVMCGPSAGSNAYLLAGSIFASNAVLGDAAAEIGAGLLSATVADIPSMTATTAISCRFTSTTANVVAATAGTATFYIEGVTYP